jgi:hypothetical protein
MAKRQYLNNQARCHAPLPATRRAIAGNAHARPRSGGRANPNQTAKGKRMPRKSTSSFEPSPECAAAYERILDLAHRLAAALVGEKLSRDGKALGPYGLPLVIGMLYFLLRIPPQDLNTLFFTKDSLKDLNFRPYTEDPAGFALLADLFPR